MIGCLLDSYAVPLVLASSCCPRPLDGKVPENHSNRSADRGLLCRDFFAFLDYPWLASTAIVSAMRTGAIEGMLIVKMKSVWPVGASRLVLSIFFKGATT